MKYITILIYRSSTTTQWTSAVMRTAKQSTKGKINMKCVFVLTIAIAHCSTVHVEMMMACYKYNNMNWTTVTKQNYLCSVVGLLSDTDVNPLIYCKQTENNNMHILISRTHQNDGLFLIELIDGLLLNDCLLLIDFLFLKSFKKLSTLF